MLKMESPCWRSSSNRPLHSSLNRLAPVKLPSPPITHRLVMPCCTRLCAAFRRPSWVRNSLQRALPMTVPPWEKHRLQPGITPETLLLALFCCCIKHFSTGRWGFLCFWLFIVFQWKDSITNPFSFVAESLTVISNTWYVTDSAAPLSQSIYK